MSRILYCILFIITISFFSCTKNTTKISKPRLVVGIVIDQMRYDYITRFYDRYSNSGFKRLIRNGFSLENAHYNLIPTYTAVGHATIYTGTTPNNHGIISNNWYDKFLKKTIYCVDDSNYEPIGTKANIGKKSPYRLFTTTITDQLKLSQNMNGKTIGIAIKDRSSILPAGHTANAAYWYDAGEKGHFISSSFYLKKLPKWVTEFNAKELPKQYLSQSWETLYDINTYNNSILDNNNFERPFNGKKTPTFPYDLSKLMTKNDSLRLINSTPFGNSLTLDFAKASITGENLGKSNFTDFLAISFSSTDYVGHQFGPKSIEIEDTYLRLDKDIAELLSFLDNEVGINNYTVFLTADHAAVDVPAYLQTLKIPAHYFNTNKFRDFVLGLSKKYFSSEELIENISNHQIFLNRKKIEFLGLNKQIVIDKLVEEIINYDGIYKVISSKTFQTTRFTDGILNSLQNGYNQKLSGDILMIPYPNTLTGARKGTSHGSGYSYDTHVPVIFYGNGIKKGKTAKKYYITDIAPTIANLLKIEAPNATNGKIIVEALQN